MLKRQERGMWIETCQHRLWQSGIRRQAGGGGQPGFAQAGGKDTDGLSVAIETLRQSLM